MLTCPRLRVQHSSGLQASGLQAGSRPPQFTEVSEKFLDGESIMSEPEDPGRRAVEDLPIIP